MLATKELRAQKSSYSRQFSLTAKDEVATLAGADEENLSVSENDSSEIEEMESLEVYEDF
jgi:hypothetical protein